MAASAAAEGGAVRRLYAVSDVHSDFPENMTWVKRLKEKGDYGPGCALIVAGDVSDNLSILEETLVAFQAAFEHVFFTPGNHDVWLRTGDAYKDSIEKWHAIFALCSRLGVHTKPVHLPGGPLVVPLHSWYHEDWDKEPDIDSSVWEGIQPIGRAMNDYRRCKWPDGAANGTAAVAEAVDRLNEGIPSTADIADVDVVSFSHFLPFQELCPEKRFLYMPNLPKAVGSAPLRERVRDLRPAIHCFGHTHFGWDSTVEGVRCVQPCVAYPREREARRRSGLSVSADIVHLPLLLWQAEGGWGERRSCLWSDYYDKHARTPENTIELADYVARLYRRVK
eukprot:TRINITY_DN29023_c0_g1_i1.p1 TRINITY_DN29023_c0_g1~~TRINITY_DN29023_c0_g1_i1.p1  ORF type:complete len:364 (+),score=58.79 TRINITY_DN29023_c0_g1_i1:87-1094(+)